VAVAEIVVEGTARAEVALAFATIVPIDLTRIFTGLGPLPAVVGRHGQTGSWQRVGATRIVELSNGSEVREEITAHEPPRYFAYRVGPFAGPLGRLADHADGDWRFAELGAGLTGIRWRYAFALRSPVARPLVIAAWRAYARRVLRRAIAEVEAATPPG
jgi:hypothetical protein